MTFINDAFYYCCTTGWRDPSLLNEMSQCDSLDEDECSEIFSVQRARKASQSIVKRRVGGGALGASLTGCKSRYNVISLPPAYSGGSPTRKYVKTKNFQIMGPEGLSNQISSKVSPIHDLQEIPPISRKLGTESASQEFKRRTQARKVNSLPMNDSKFLGWNPSDDSGVPKVFHVTDPYAPIFEDPLSILRTTSPLRPSEPSQPFSPPSPIPSPPSSPAPSPPPPPLGSPCTSSEHKKLSQTIGSFTRKELDQQIPSEERKNDNEVIPDDARHNILPLRKKLSRIGSRISEQLSNKITSSFLSNSSGSSENSKEHNHDDSDSDSEEESSGEESDDSLSGEMPPIPQYVKKPTNYSKSDIRSYFEVKGSKAVNYLEEDGITSTFSKSTISDVSDENKVSKDSYSEKGKTFNLDEKCKIYEGNLNQNHIDGLEQVERDEQKKRRNEDIVLNRRDINARENCNAELFNRPEGKDVNTNKRFMNKREDMEKSYYIPKFHNLRKAKENSISQTYCNSTNDTKLKFSLIEKNNEKMNFNSSDSVVDCKIASSHFFTRTATMNENSREKVKIDRLVHSRSDVSNYYSTMTSSRNSSDENDPNRYNRIAARPKDKRAGTGNGTRDGSGLGPRPLSEKKPSRKLGVDKLRNVVFDGAAARKMKKMKNRISRTRSGTAPPGGGRPAPAPAAATGYLRRRPSSLLRAQSGFSSGSSLDSQGVKWTDDDGLEDLSFETDNTFTASSIHKDADSQSKSSFHVLMDIARK